MHSAALIRPTMPPVDDRVNRPSTENGIKETRMESAANIMPMGDDPDFAEF